MPRKYKRKAGVQPRVITWTEDSLAAAIAEMQDKRLSINDIAKRNGIPSRTLRRRFATQNKKITSLGKYSTLGFENERRLVAHIQKLEQTGFILDGKTVRALGYQFAEKLKIKHNFNAETKLAGTNWLQSFLERNPILSIRQAEGVSDSSALDLNMEEINDLLTKIMEENDLVDKPDRIFNLDETGVLMNKDSDVNRSANTDKTPPCKEEDISNDSLLIINSNDPLDQEAPEMLTDNAVNAGDFNTENLNLAPKPNEDEFDIYCKHVACQLRNLPLPNAIKCQSVINQILSDERLKVIYGQSSQS